MTDELKKADEVVRAMRDYASDCDGDVCFLCTFACVCDKFDNNAPKIIADLIESLTAQLASVTAERDALKERTHAEKDGQLYTVHDVAVILANAIGDDCACNINSNDEWLPQVCELQEACPHPVGVACWEQYLKHRDEAEKALGKEQGHDE